MDAFLQAVKCMDVSHSDCLGSSHVWMPTLCLTWQHLFQCIQVEHVVWPSPRHLILSPISFQIVCNSDHKVASNMLFQFLSGLIKTLEAMNTMIIYTGVRNSLTCLVNYGTKWLGSVYIQYYWCIHTIIMFFNLYKISMHGL